MEETLTVEEIRKAIKKIPRNPRNYKDMWYVCVNCYTVHKGFPPDWIVLCDKCREELGVEKI